MQVDRGGFGTYGSSVSFVSRDRELAEVQARLMARSLRDSLHQDPRLVVAERQVFGVQARPASLLLRQGQALGVADNLSHACMAEQMRVDGCQLADSSVT